jgi:K+ transporter
MCHTEIDGAAVFLAHHLSYREHRKMMNIISHNTTQHKHNTITVPARHTHVQVRVARTRTHTTHTYTHTGYTVSSTLQQAMHTWGFAHILGRAHCTINQYFHMGMGSTVSLLYCTPEAVSLISYSASGESGICIV